jgi:hypothetical protein
VETALFDAQLKVLAHFVAVENLAGAQSDVLFAAQGTFGVYHVHGDPLWLDQVSLWIDGTRSRFTRGIQPGASCDQRCRIAR